MVDSGNGDGASVRAEVAPMVASSQPSKPKGKRNTKSAKKPGQQFGARAALEFLNSAVAYCNQAGLRVTYVNQAGRLVVFVYGAKYDPTSTGSNFVMDEAQPAPAPQEPTP